MPTAASGLSTEEAKTKESTEKMISETETFIVVVGDENLYRRLCGVVGCGCTFCL
jgi:hypothetical protein